MIVYYYLEYKMAASVENQFWRQRSSHGRNPTFESGDELFGACTEYFNWVDENPLIEHQASSFKGEVQNKVTRRMRAMTINGMCIFLNITDRTWQNYRKRDGFAEATMEAECIIWQQKFEGAAAGMLNGNIISREIGLKDSHVLTVGGGVGGIQIPLIAPDMTPKQASLIYRQEVENGSTG